MPYNKITLAELIEAWESAGSPTVCDGDHRKVTEEAE